MLFDVRYVLSVLWNSQPMVSMNPAEWTAI